MFNNLPTFNCSYIYNHNHYFNGLYIVIIITSDPNLFINIAPYKFTVSRTAVHADRIKGTDLQTQYWQSDETISFYYTTLWLLS